MRGKEKGRMRTILGFCSGSLRLNGSKVEKSPSQPLRFTTSQIWVLLTFGGMVKLWSECDQWVDKEGLKGG